MTDKITNWRTKPNVVNFFHVTENGRIFCTLIGQPEESEECVIYFSPLFEERMWSHRIAFNFALELASARNIAVLMFDYQGYGESGGAAEDFTLSGNRAIVESLLARMRNIGFCRFSWWGIRTGCTVALALKPHDLQPESIILWAPILNLNEYIYDSLRATIAAQYMIFNKALVTRDVILEELTNTGECVREGIRLNYIEGYRFGKAFYRETEELEAAVDLGRVTSPSIVLELVRPGARNGNTEAKPSRICAASQGNPNISYRQVTDRPFWVIGKDYSQRADALYSATFAWLEERNQ